MISTRTLGRSRKGGNVIIAAIVASALILLIGVGIWYQFLRDDAPPPVTLSGAVSTLDDATPTSSAASATATSTQTPAAAIVPSATTAPLATSAPTEPAATATSEATAAGLDGAWVIDGSQDTFVGYRVGEELARVGTTEAVGRTPDVTGSVTVSDMIVTEATFEADLTTLQSDESMRDGQLDRQGIETGTYPTASFTLTQPITLDSSLADGSAISVMAIGDLTLHGVTKSVEIPLDLQYSNGVIVVVGSLDILFADFNIEQPSSMRVLSIDDHGILELQLFFIPA